jgi:very-short-patch-repair endonuclease
MAEELAVRLDEVASAQHGLITSAQAVKALGPSRKTRWVSDRRLVSVQPRVFRVAGSHQTWHQAVHAAALATEGIVSHRAAAELWGLIKPAGYVEVSVRYERNPTARPPAIVHRIADLHPRFAVAREGMQVTDPMRTIVDLGLVLPSWAVGDALSRGLTTRLFTITEVEGLRVALGRPGRAGTGVVRHLIEKRMLTADTEASLLEARLVDLATHHNLSPLAYQHEVWSAGRFIARIDAAYPHLLLAIEVDGYESHSSPDAFQRDRTRQNYLVALGWTVLRFTWHDVVHDSATVARTIRDMVARLEAA